MRRWLAVLAFLSSAFVSIGGPSTPEVGSIAPPLGNGPWIQLDAAAGGTAPEIAALRGKVVVVSTYGYYCDSCVRVGVPLANAMRVANGDELRVIGLTVGIAEDTPEKIREEAKKLGVEHSVAQCGAEGDSSPYLNLGISPSLTYAFVITRTGGVLWKGDPSREREVYLDAVRRALHAVPAEPLPESLAPELAPAVRAYVEGDFSAVEPATQAVLKKLGSKSTPQGDRARADATTLLALVAETKRKLMEELEKSAGDQQPERFQRASEFVRRAFPKGECADRAGQLEMYMCIQQPHGPECKRWATWFALESSRPPIFPRLKDKLTSKYAKELTKYAKQPDVPGLETVRGWLREFESARELK